MNPVFTRIVWRVLAHMSLMGRSNRPDPHVSTLVCLIPIPHDSVRAGSMASGAICNVSASLLADHLVTVVLRRVRSSLPRAGNRSLPELDTSLPSLWSVFRHGLSHRHDGLPSTSSPSLGGGDARGRRPTGLYHGGFGESVPTHFQCRFPGQAAFYQPPAYPNTPNGLPGRFGSLRGGARRLWALRIFTPIGGKTSPQDALCWTFPGSDDLQYPGIGSSDGGGRRPDLAQEGHTE